MTWKAPSRFGLQARPVPEPDRGVVGYIHRYAKKNHWRVAKWWSYDDLVQECLLCYCQARNRYPEVVDPPHFMDLFKRCLISHIGDFLRIQGRHAKHGFSETPMSVMVKVGEDGEFEPVEIGEPEMATLFTLIKEAPAEIKTVLEALVSDIGLDKLCEPYRVGNHGVRETTNARLRRIAGLATDGPDVKAALVEYLTA